MSCCVTIKISQDGTQQLIYVTQQDTNYRLDYYKLPEEMVDDADTSDPPDKEVEDVLVNLVAGELLYAQYMDDPLGLRGK